MSNLTVKDRLTNWGWRTIGPTFQKVYKARCNRCFVDDADGYHRKIVCGHCDHWCHFGEVWIA